MRLSAFIGTVLGLAVFCSCSREDVVLPDAQADGRIVFGLETGTLADVATKAVTESTDASVKSQGFKVAAVGSANDVIFNEKVSYASSKDWYATATPYYWPSSGSLSFYAAYPSAQSITVTAGSASLSYTDDRNTDLIAAKAVGVEKPATAQPVALAFDHILSQVNINAKGAVDDGLTFRVKSISIEAPGSGTYAYASGTWSPAAGATKGFYTGPKDIAGTTLTPLGESQTVLPGSIIIKVTYDVLSGSSVILSFTDKSVLVNVSMGKKSTVNLTLPSSGASQLSFTVSVSPWGSEEHDVTLS